MTLVELQDKLSEQINLITDPTASFEEKKKRVTVSNAVSNLAKQMINNANVTLRADKVMADGQRAHEALSKIVGE